MSLIFGIIGTALILVTFFFTKERTTGEDQGKKQEDVPVMEALKLLFLLLTIIAKISMVKLVGKERTTMYPMICSTNPIIMLFHLPTFSTIFGNTGSRIMEGRKPIMLHMPLLHRRKVLRVH